MPDRQRPESIRWETTAPGSFKALFGGAVHGLSTHGKNECLNLFDLAAAAVLAGRGNGGKALEVLNCFRRFGRSVHSAISGG